MGILRRSSAHKTFHEYMLANPVFMHDLTALSYFGGTATEDCYNGLRGMYDCVSV